MKCDCEYCDDDELFAEFKGGFYRAAQLLKVEKDMLDLIVKCETREELIRWTTMYGELLT